MSELYGTSHIESMEEMAGSDVVMELFLIDDVASGSSEQIRQFCESTEGKILLEKKAFAKKVLTKEEQMKKDLNRRIKLIAYRLAKDNSPALFNKMVKHLRLKKQYSNEIMQKYGTKATRLAKMAQKKYIATMRAAKDNTQAED